MGSTAYMPPAYLLRRLHFETFQLIQLAARRVRKPFWRTHHPTHWFANILLLDEVSWIGFQTPICSGPPSSQASDPVRVGHQWLHQSHRLKCHRDVCCCNTCGQVAQHAAEKKSGALGLVRECPGLLTLAGHDVLARIERGLSPKASADWPLMRDTVSVNNE